MLLAKALPGRLALVAGLALLGGALPAVFAALVAELVKTLPTAVQGGIDTPAGRHVVGILVGIGVVLVAQQVMVLRGVAIEDLFWRYDGYLLGRIMRTTLSVPRLELYEDPELAAKADRGVRFVPASPGEIAAGYGDKWAAQAQGLAAAILVATVWPLAAVGLAAVWLAVGKQLQTNYARAREGLADPGRRSRYLQRLGLLPEWAKEVRVFGLVDWLGDRFGREWATVMAELWRARRKGQLPMALLFAGVAVANGAVLGFAIWSALDGTLGVGPLVLVVQGLLGMAYIADQETDYLIDLGVLPIPDVLALEQAAAAIPAATGTMPAAGRPVHEIRFNDVRFAYPGREVAVFDGLELSIQAGRSLGVVGLNGAGKTTLIKLLTGLEVPQRGRITVDDVDLLELAPHSWWQAVAAIFQDFARYELAARDNIGFGALEKLRHPNADREILGAAARSGAVDVLARLPAGLDTPLSRRFDGGVDISGGQWQRIALARAVMAVQAGARVLVLDEPTAQLDVRAEADVYDRFLELTQGLTTIVISHRFSTVRRADRIVVLDGGRVSEDGSHDDLIAANGQYARLFRTQATHYVDATSGDEDA